ncbi:MAG: hypothetical protein CMM87_00250 [Rickettsiales bacterium]|nr:hypothetical protein [Rickettsiales bacterium]
MLRPLIQLSKQESKYLQLEFMYLVHISTKKMSKKMFKKICLTAVLVLTTIINALPPEWPADFGDRETIHAKLTEMKGDLERVRKAKFEIDIYASQDLTEKNVEIIVGAADRIIGFEKKEKENLVANLRSKKDETRKLTIAGLTFSLKFEKEEYNKLIHFCTIALEESANSIYGFFDLLWHSRELYHGELEDLKKRPVGSALRTNTVCPKKYLEFDMFQYKRVYETLFSFVEEKLTGNSLSALTAKPKRLKSYRAPMQEEFKEFFLYLQEQQRNILAIDEKEVLGDEKSCSFLNLRGHCLERTLPIYQQLFSESKAPLESAKLFATNAANQVFKRILNPYYSALQRHEEERVMRRQNEEAALAVGKSAHGSTVPGTEGFSMLAAAAEMGIDPTTKFESKKNVPAADSGASAAAAGAFSWDQDDTDTSSSEDEE